MDNAVAPRGQKAPPFASERGLDWFAFFLADIQTGWGPFVAAYLTAKSWTQLDIGLILTFGTLAAMVLQIPMGALVDHVPAKRLLAAVAVAAISGSALLLALWPIFSIVLAAKVLHAIASCLAGPVLAAISLGLVGHTCWGGGWAATLASSRSAMRSLPGCWEPLLIIIRTKPSSSSPLHSACPRSLRWPRFALRTSIPNWRAAGRENERSPRGQKILLVSRETGHC